MGLQLYISNLILTHFKNYEYQEIDFSPGVNLLFGVNGSGKTNVLDAIQYLALTKSHFLPQDKMAVKHESLFFRIEGNFQKLSEKLHIVLTYQNGQKKITTDDKIILKNADHIGVVGIVFIAPDDLEIIDGLSGLRRKYIDTSLSQSDHAYLIHLTNYKKLLDQRNSYLKQLDPIDTLYLHVLNDKMYPHARYIFEKRKLFCLDLSIRFRDYYLKISNHTEEVNIKYQSDLSGLDFLELLKKNESVDLRQRITTRGIHKDDLIFEINGHPVRYTASQGQKKTFLVGLFLAQADYLREAMHSEPILLLDDIFDKLDQTRMQYLLQTLKSEKQRQIILTDTSKSRIQNILTTLSDKAKYLEVKNATIIPLD